MDDVETLACGAESVTPSTYVLGLSWEDLLPFDGVALPAMVHVAEDRNPVECTELPEKMAIFLNGAWYLARQPSCPQLA